MHYKDYVFFKREGEDPQQVPHERYVALMHRTQPMQQYAKQHVHVAIFYVEMKDSRPAEVVNANYSLLEFDESGFADPHAAKHSIEDNRAFFAAVRNSNFNNIDCDPEIQKLRAKLGEEFSWAPTDQELSFMVQSIFSSGANNEGQA